MEKDFIKNAILKLSAAAGVPGLTGALDVAEELLSGVPGVRRDHMGGLWCTLPGKSKIHLAANTETPALKNYQRTENGEPVVEKHILLDAHLDEIGFIVTSVDTNGFVRCDKCGSADARLLPGTAVIIHGKEKIPGVFCVSTPHLSGVENAVPDITDLCIDTGTSNAELLISPGDRVTFDQTPVQLLGRRLTGKSLDDRAGVAAVIAAFLRLFEEGAPPCTVTLLLSGQEEVGLRGAKTAAFSLFPDEALAVDVTFGGSYQSPAHKTGKMGGGPMIGVSPVLDYGITERLKTLAKSADIPFQLEVMSGKTSTNADVISLTKTGVRCGLVSIPLRYMHTPVEVIDLADTEATAELLYLYVKEAAERD